MAVHPVTGLVYVASWGDGTVSVLDKAGRGVLGTVKSEYAAAGQGEEGRQR